jgi:AI-2 transport protein TqsA
LKKPTFDYQFECMPTPLKLPLSIVAIAIVLVALYMLKFIFIPVAMSLFLVGLFIPLMQRFKERKIPAVLGVVILLIFIVIFFGIVDIILLLTRDEFQSKSGELSLLFSEKLSALYALIDNYTGIDISKDLTWGETFDLMTDASVLSTVSPYLSVFNSFIGMTLMTIIYSITLLGTSYDYKKYLLYLGGERSGALYLAIFEGWLNDLRIYIRVKTIMSIITGSLFGLVCFAFGLDFALFFGLTAFLLNYIPNLGSVIATILPVALAFVQFETMGMVVIFGLILLGMQLLLGSLIEVKYIGKSFSIPMVIVFVNLLFWGYLWGMAGIILSVPFIIFIKNWATIKNPNGTLGRFLSGMR